MVRYKPRIVGGLSAFLKVIGFIIPLMDPEYTSYYMKEVTIILIREFQMLDKETKKIILKVVKQCVATEGVMPAHSSRIFQGVLGAVYGSG